MRTQHGAMTVSDARLPIVDVAYHSALTLPEYRESFEEYARLAAKGIPLAYLIDMRKFDPLRISAADRREAAAIFREYAPRLLPVSVAEARVISSPLTRGIVTAFDWLTAVNKWPCQQFATMESAEAWLRAELRRAEVQGGKPRP